MPTATATASSAPPLVPLACPLRLAPLPAIISVGGSEVLRVVTQPDVAVRISLGAGTSRRVAAVFADPGQSVGQLITGTPDGNGYQYAIRTGGTGQALLSFPVPADAPLGPAPVQASASCGSDELESETSFTVQPLPVNAAANGLAARDVVTASPVTHLSLALHDLLVRGVEPPPLAGSAAHDTLSLPTDAYANVTLDATIVSKSGANLGTALDGGTAYASGDDIGTQMATADPGGGVSFSVPISSTLLTPGRGAVVHLSVTSVAPGSSTGTVYLTSFPIREVRLRLVVQVLPTSRGGLRPRCVVSRRAGGASTCRVLVVADRGAHITGTMTLGSTTLGSSVVQTAGVGGRAMLQFAIPNTFSGPRGMQFPGTVSVTSTFRGASITRTASFSYGSL